MAADLQLPHELPAANKTLTAQCHCKSVHFTVTIPASALPLPVHLCHCSICRTTHGTFSCFHASLPKGVEPAFVASSSVESSLTGYIHSDQAACERFFCTTCGCHVGDRDREPNPETGKPEWRVATSIFDVHDEETFQIRSHWFTSPATQPDLSTWLPSIGSRALRVYNPGPDDPIFPLAGTTASPPNADISDLTTANPADVLLAQCHCAGVRFTIPRPSETEANDPFLARFLRATPSPPDDTSTSDAHHTDGNSSANAADTPVKGEDTLKRIACLCVCTDCRLTSGAHATPWLFLPLSSLSPSVPPSLETPGMTLRCYRSSEKVRRAFCRVCGATVLYALDEEGRVPSGEEGEKKRVVDVAVGLLRDPVRGGVEGDTALEKWITWRTGRLGGLQSGREFDGAFAEALGKGMRDWGVKRYGEVVGMSSREL